MHLVGSPAVTQLIGPLRRLTDGDSQVTVAVIDGPVDVSHPAFAAAAIEGLLGGWCAGPEAGAAAQHGTHIASLIFGGADGEWNGIAPGCKGLMIAVFTDGPEGRLRLASQQTLAHSISLAAAAGADIVNISAGRPADAQEADAYLTEAIAECRRRGTLVIAAAGNDGCECHHLPAALPDVTVVGAIGDDGRPLDFSNWGKGYRRSGLLAPGAQIHGAQPGGGYAPRTGTSFAAAVVSGAAALLLSLARRLGLPLTGRDIGELLIKTARPCPHDEAEACAPFLAGLADIEAATASLLSQVQERTAVRLLGRDTIGDRSHQARGGSNMSETAGTSAIAAEAAVPIMQSFDRPTGEAHALIAPSEAVPAAAETIAPLGCSCGGGAGECSCGTKKADCGCAGSKQAQKVYALGALWYDFGTEARYDALLQLMTAHNAGVPDDPEDLIKFLRKNPIHAQGLTFTLNQEATPIYAIVPAGPFAAQAYDAILEGLEAEIKARKKDARAAGLQRTSLPGFIAGKTRLANHMEVPAVVPDLRGMYRWTPDALVSAVTVKRAAATADEAAAGPPEEEIYNFLARVYYELRNLGLAPEHRAINYAATNAYQAATVFEDAAGRELVLDTIGVVKSPVCRPDSDCWDVDIRMFDPENERRASRVYRFTVDVSEIIPVTVGAMRSWAAR